MDVEKSTRPMWLTVLAYAWAFFPGTLIGLCVVPIAMLSGGRCRWGRGCLEIEGGTVAWFLRRGMPWMRGASAMTLGHVILGQDERLLDLCREHEHVHVRQYERWGPFFLPAYAVSSCLAWWRGGNPYRENRFEREAYGE